MWSWDQRRSADPRSGSGACDSSGPPTFVFGRFVANFAGCRIPGVVGLAVGTCMGGGLAGDGRMDSTPASWTESKPETHFTATNIPRHATRGYASDGGRPRT